MMLPRLLVIDDQVGSSFESRRDMCFLYGLQDITFDDPQPEEIHKPVAVAHFSQGQILRESFIENSIDIALDAVNIGWPFSDGGYWSAVLLDLRFVSGRLGPNSKPLGETDDDLFGLKILQAIKEKIPDVPVLILSSRERSTVIEDCRKLGASDFIQRHADNDGQSPREVLASKLREYGLLEDSRGIIAGRSLPLLKTLAAARRAATGVGNILLLGESGTGKELIAKYIHDNSPKSDGPYRVLKAHNTAESLQEDLLFGHEKGAFTGANVARAGLFEQADCGTLFLDEIGDISEFLQNKLLRPIETRTIARQGGDHEKSVDVQLVLATNKSLEEYASTGRFKFDLLNRIQAYDIAIPPLRERKEDIPLLSQNILEKLCIENNARWPRSIDPEAMDLLCEHSWTKGNVRELRNVLERAVKNNKDSELVVARDLQFFSPLSSSQNPEFKAVPEQIGTGPEAESDWIDALRNITIHEDYDVLHASWPKLHREIMQLLVRYLAATLKVNRRKGEINLSDAVSCIKGVDVDKNRAADLVKRLLSFDDGCEDSLLDAYPVVRTALEESLRLRPKVNKNKK